MLDWLNNSKLPALKSDKGDESIRLASGADRNVRYVYNDKGDMGDARSGVRVVGVRVKLQCATLAGPDRS
jgi:hypothetical protein